MSPPPALQTANPWPANQLLEKNWTDSSLKTDFRPQHAVPHVDANWATEFGKLGQLTPGPVIQHTQNLTPQQDCTCSLRTRRLLLMTDAYFPQSTGMPFHRRDCMVYLVECTDHTGV